MRMGYPIGYSPEDVASADVNLDGFLDLVSGNNASNGVSVLLGNGSGTFQSPVSYPAGSTSVSRVAISDINGDNRPDLVTSNYYNNSISLLLGTITGTFQLSGTIPVGANPNSVVVRYFDANNTPDIAVANFGSGTVSVLLNDGNGGFRQPGGPYPIPNPATIAVGDFDGIGGPDLVVASEASSVGAAVLLNNGDGTFGSAVFHPIGAANAYAVAVGDFNRDGNLDLAVGSYNASNVYILLGNGNGTFQTPVPYPAPITNSVVTGDFNGDNKLDLAIGRDDNPGNSISILLGNGDGSFQGPTPFQVGNAAHLLAAGDFNGDNRLDLAVTDSTDNNISVLINNCVALTPTATNTPISAATSTPTPTQVPTATGVLVGHVTWQGRTSQPSPGQIMPITLTVKMNNTEVNYPYQLTDASGFFTVTVAGLPVGPYIWRAKGPTYLASLGTLTLTIAPVMSVEMGLQRTGDLNGDNAVNAQDFNLIKGSFGMGGAPPIGPKRP